MNLEPQWKVGDPEDYAWRVRNVYTQHMRKFLPAPGFIGKALSAAELTALRVPGRKFGLRVSQLNAGAHRAGMRAGDVVVSAGGRSHFTDVREFHAWCESLRVAGRDIRMQLLRQGCRDERDDSVVPPE